MSNEYSVPIDRFQVMVANLDEWKSGFLILTTGNKFRCLGENKFRLDVVTGLVYLLDTKNVVNCIIDIEKVEGVQMNTKRG